MSFNVLIRIVQCCLLMQDDVVDSGEGLIADLEDAVLNQRLSRVSGSKLEEARGNRYRTQIQNRLNQLQGGKKCLCSVFELVCLV